MADTKPVYFRARPIDLERIRRITEHLKLIRPDMKESTTSTVCYALAEIERLINAISESQTEQV